MSLPVSAEEPMLHPTLFIGLGEIGVQFLAQIQQRMPTSFETGAACLGVCVGKRKTSHTYPDPLGFDMNSVIELSWDREQARRLVERSDGLQWWVDGLDNEKTEPRLNSRMAFVMAIHFQHDMRIQNRLKTVIKSLNVNETNPIIIYLVASLRDPEAAFIGDLVSEIYTWIGRKSVRALLPCLMLNDSRRSVSARSAWTVAGLRELERMMQLGKQVVTGLPAEFSPSGVNIVSGGLFNQVMVIDNESSLDPLADQLVALVEQDAALKFSAVLCNVPPAASLSVMVSSNHTFIVPLEDLRAGSALRLLKEELFRTDTEDAFSQRAVIEFLRGEPSNSPIGWEAFGWFADAIEKKARSGAHLLTPSRKLPELFNSQLEQFLNQKFELSLSNGKLFLNVLIGSMEKSCASVARMGEGGNVLIDQMPEFRGIIANIIKAIEQWEKVIKDLEIRISSSYEDLLRSLSGLKAASSLKSVYWRGLREPDPLAPAYDELRNQPNEVWQTLTTELRQVLHWQWASPVGEQPYLRCLIQDIAYTEPETMFFPLFKHAYLLTDPLNKNANIYKSLGRLSAQQVVNIFDQAPLLAKRDPLLSPERRMAHFLVGGEDTMIASWNLSADINVCKAHTKHRLTYLRFEFNLLAAGLKAYTDGEDDYLHCSPYIHVYPHEQYARQIEMKMESINQPQSIERCLQSPFTRLMQDTRLFEIVMWCIFFDWVKRESDERGIYSWRLDAAGQLSFLLESNRFPANTLSDAIVNFIISFPLEDLEGLHPLSHQNFNGTLSRLEVAILSERNRSYIERKRTYLEIEQRINEWKASKDPFYKSLAIFQRGSLASEKKRRGKLPIPTTAKNR